MGLGSSAALGVACARLLLSCAGRAVDPREVAEVALEMEREFHGTPSGIDHTTSAMGGLVLFRRRPGKKRGTAKWVKSPKPLKVLVALAGKRQSTKETVFALRERMEKWPGRYGRLIREIGRVAEEGVRAVEEGDLEALGDAMTVNHGLLAAMGLSAASLDEMVHRLRRMGALGAKLTGAGGEGGAVVGLFLEPAPAVARLRRAGVVCFASQLAGPEAP
jgi:mevalonate kinase